MYTGKAITPKVVIRNSEGVSLVNGTDYDVSGIAEKALKNYKSVHKRKIVTEFVVYVKPEENAAYFTVNGEGSDEFKIEL